AEEWLVGFAIVFVGNVDCLLVRRKFLDHKWTGTDWGESEGVVCFLRLLMQNVLRKNHGAAGTGDNFKPDWIRLLEVECDREVIDDFHVFNRVEDVIGERTIVGVYVPLPCETDILGGKRLAIAPDN